MSDFTIFVVAAILAVGGIVAAIVTTLPRPATIREAAYLALPLGGVIVLVVATATRF